MRLLHASRGEIKSFIVDDEIPPFAILSHSWGEEEISFQDWRDTPTAELSLRKGYLKIRYCCEQALRDGLEWVWVDTCCIDKTSSAELSESINSMFRWYSNSKICYAYLSDVSRNDSQSMFDSEFSKSRWFTRGWTLQELIAPAVVIFYSKDWDLLGSKSGLWGLIHSTTLIEPKFLDGANLHLASVAKIMSWAAHRKTSRIEDVAYSLLGLFDINMPLIYGEGRKAFRRLQEEIIKTRSEDHSIFAWGTIVPRPSTEVTDPGQLSGTKAIPWTESKGLLGLLAESPKDFASSGKFVPTRRAAVYYRSSSRNIALPVPVDTGVRIHLPIISHFHSVYHWHRPKMSQVRQAMIVVLFCCDEEHPRWLVQIPLQRWGYMNYARTPELLFDSTATLSQEESLIKSAKLLHIAPEKRREFRCGDVILRRHLFEDTYHAAGWTFGSGYNEFDDEGVLEVNGGIHGKFIAILHELNGAREYLGFALCLGRTSQDGARWGPFTVGLVPVTLDRLHEGVEYEGIQFHDSRLALDRSPAYNHVMSTPYDTWALDVAPFPFIRVKAQRVRFGGEDIFVDVVDIVISTLPGGTNYV